MALTISSCNTFHMLPELPCFHNHYLNPKIYTKLLSELLYSCTPELLKKQLLKSHRIYLVSPLLCFRWPSFARGSLFFCSNRPSVFAVDGFLAVASSVFDSQFHVALCGGFGVVEMAAMGQGDEKMRVRLKKAPQNLAMTKNVCTFATA